MFKFNPARTIAAVAVAAQAIVAVFAVALALDGSLVVAIDSAVTAVIAIFGTLFVEAKSVSVAGLNALAEADEVLDNKG